MVWEQNSSIIIMLTKEVENGRLKCDRYWSSVQGIPLECGKFSISLESETEGKALTTKKFSITNKENNQVRKVLHVQYTAWPDFGIPSNTTSFLDLIPIVNENKKNAPVIVHCSAGIGRTGTFCTVHSIVEKLKADFDQRGIGSTPTCNVIETVLKLREQRTGMVQTKEQYTFCYLAIQEAIERLRYDKLADHCVL